MNSQYFEKIKPHHLDKKYTSFKKCGLKLLHKKETTQTVNA